MKSRHTNHRPQQQGVSIERHSSRAHSTSAHARTKSRWPILDEELSSRHAESVAGWKVNAAPACEFHSLLMRNSRQDLDFPFIDSGTWDWRLESRALFCFSSRSRLRTSSLLGWQPTKLARLDLSERTYCRHLFRFVRPLPAVARESRSVSERRSVREWCRLDRRYTRPGTKVRLRF